MNSDTPWNVRMKVLWPMWWPWVACPAFFSSDFLWLSGLWFGTFFRGVFQPPTSFQSPGFCWHRGTISRIFHAGPKNREILPQLLGDQKSAFLLVSSPGLVSCTLQRSDPCLLDTMNRSTAFRHWGVFIVRGKGFITYDSTHLQQIIR